MVPQRLARLLGLTILGSLAIHVFFLIAGRTFLSAWRWEHDPVHAAAETCGALVAFLVAWMLVGLERRGEGTHFNVWISGALIGMGALDGLHALTFVGNTFVWLHSTATFVGGLLFALVWLPQPISRRVAGYYHWAVLAGIGGFGLGSMAFADIIPAMVREQEFTATAKVLNVVGGILLLAAAIRLVLAYRQTNKVDDLLFCLHCTLFGAAAVMFEQSELWDAPWWGWHALRLLAYGVALAFAVHVERDAQAALAAGEERVRLLLESTGEAIYGLDLKGKCTFANPACVRLLGYPDPEALLGRNMHDLIHHTREDGTPYPVQECLIYQAIRGGTGTHVDDEVLWRADGTAFPAEYRSRPIRRDGATVGGVVTFTDVTSRKAAEEERRALEAQMRHTQKLESLGVLAGGIAHDFNNLLAGILGGAELAQMDLPPESPVHEHLDDIRTSALHAAELTKQMLAYSGKGLFVVEPLNLNRLVEEIAHLLEATLPKGVILKHDFAADLPAVEADAAQMRQVIMNLIINAGEAIGARSGIITVSTGVVVADATYLAEIYLDDDLAPGDYVCVKVSDTGEGMDAETRDRIFEPFFTTKFQGRGLGLSAVLGIAQGHGGALKVYSEPGQGTTFKMLLPAGHRPAAEREGAITNGGWQGSGTVLVVDDEERVRHYAKQVLTRLGFTVLTADDGREGVNMFQAHAAEIVLVLLDMTMPYLNGTEAFAEMRRVQPDATVILSSGYSEQEATSRFAGKGLAGFIQKPYDVPTLRATIRAVLDP